MPFELKNAPATFQENMDYMFRKEGLLDDVVAVYLDDIIIKSRTKEQHIKDIQRVLEVLRRWKYYAKLKKCDFMKQEIAYLRRIICDGEVLVDLKKTKAIQQWQ